MFAYVHQEIYYWHLFYEVQHHFKQYACLLHFLNFIQKRTKIYRNLLHINLEMKVAVSTSICGRLR